MTAYRYDSDNRLTGTISPDPDGAGPLKYATVRNAYDAAGQLVSVSYGEIQTWQSEAVAPPSWTGFTIHRTLDTVYDKVWKRTGAKGSLVYLPVE